MGLTELICLFNNQTLRFKHHFKGFQQKWWIFSISAPDLIGSPKLKTLVGKRSMIVGALHVRALHAL